MKAEEFTRRCRLHRIDIKMTCPVCEARIKYSFISHNHVVAFDHGYDNLNKISPETESAYDEGVKLRKAFKEA